MSEKYHVLSTAAEKTILSTLVSAVDAKNEGVSTRPGGLKGCESAGCLARMTRPQFLALSVYFGLNVTVRDIQELQAFILMGHIMAQPWYKQGDYFASQKLKQRIDGLTLNAIMQLTPNTKEKPSTVEMARNMGISVAAFNKTWAARLPGAYRYALEQLEGAALIVHKNSQK